MANKKQVLKQIREWVEPYRITNGSKFRLDKMDPADTHGLSDENKPEAKELLQKGVAWLAELQEKLYAHDRYSLLLVLQAMDAAGKDSTVKHVMSGVNPSGCQVTSFKAPSSEELDHDFLWRSVKALPERGRIGIFNRSHYEEVLVVRVHKQLLAAQKLPSEMVSKNIFKERLRDIAAFESYLHRNGTKVLKFFLNVSREEQKKRFLDRLDHPHKNWKFSSDDIKERACWSDYMRAYEDAIRATATRDSPWFVVPADNKWFTHLVVAAAIVDTMEKMDLTYPKINAAQKAELEKARAVLMAER